MIKMHDGKGEQNVALKCRTRLDKPLDFCKIWEGYEQKLETQATCCQVFSFSIHFDPCYF